MKNKIPFAIIAFLAFQTVAGPVFAITNKAAMCAADRRCAAGTPCGAGAVCDTSDRLRSAGVCNLTTAGEGRCVTTVEQTCLPDDACLNREVGASVAPPTPEPICCQCVKNSQNSCVQFSDITSCGQYAQSQSYLAFNNSNATAMQGVTCSRLLSATECRTVANGGICATGPGTISAAYSPPPAPSTSAVPPRAIIIPQLGVPIPGLQFSRPSTDGGTVAISFLAQYVAAIYRYAVQISVFVAIIMVIYGGFRYLIGSGAGDIKRGREIIQDAIIGMLLVLGAYIILFTINPQLVSFTALNLEAVKRIGFNEGEGNVNPQPSIQCAAAAPGAPASVQGARIIRLGQAAYYQCRGNWGTQIYGPTLLGQQGDRPACGPGVTGPCYDTFCQAACGATSLASVLAYYHATVNGHPVDPLDVARVAVQAGARHAGTGTDFTRLATAVPANFSGFQSRSIGHNTAAAAESIRQGRPVVFLYAKCNATCTGCEVMIGSNPENLHPGCGSHSSGHYMVLIGVSDDGQVFYIHDVGGNQAYSITAAVLQQSGMEMWTVTPTGAAPGAASATTIAQNTCAIAGAPPSRSVRGAVTRVPFTYRGDTVWPENQSFLMYPSRLTGVPNPRVHAFIFIHGANPSNTPSADADYARLLESALTSVAGTKNIVVMAPHHNGSSYSGFSLSEFYARAQATLRTALPGATIVDVAVGGHSAASCNGSALSSAASHPLSGQIAVIGYDGCLGADIRDGTSLPYIRPENFTPPGGQSVYLNPAIGGMGVDSDTRFQRYLRVRSQWGIDAVTACPACAAVGGRTVECHSRALAGGGSVYSFETQTSHTESVESMSKIMFCTLYPSG